MGMTDSQWRDNLRSRIEDREDVKELIDEGKTREALKRIERILQCLRDGLES